jgi:uncharacterized phage protein (TIGR02218 family)
MSRTISTPLRNHLARETTTLAYLWKVTRRDGLVFGFTDCDRALTYGGVTYEPATGFIASAINTSAALNVDNLDVDGFFSSEAITEADILAGVWDNAEIRVYLCNWADLSQGVMMLRRGWLGQVKTGRGIFTTELRGLMQKLQQSTGELYSPTCRASLGDARCKMNLTAFTFTGLVATVVSRRKFTSLDLAQADNYFEYGVVTWTAGANAGLSMEVKASLSADQSVELQLPMPYDIAVGDTFSIVAGCDRNLETCKTKFANILNYRGEPFLPGTDKIIRYGRNGV